MKIDILTLFPVMFDGPLGESILKRAREQGLLEINTVNIRDYAYDKHKITDDYPFGGGAGMVMKPEPIFEALNALEMNSGDNKPRVILMCPQGETFTQEKAKELALEEHLVFICGHYEGIDERVRKNVVTDELSIGDYVLTGGELPAMVIIDALARMIPGVLGEMESAVLDSFYDGLLEHPHYTRPREYQGSKVPGVLISGDHEKVRLWRRQQSLRKTLDKRPDLLKYEDLSSEDKKILEMQFDE